MIALSARTGEQGKTRHIAYIVLKSTQSYEKIAIPNGFHAVSVGSAE